MIDQHVTILAPATARAPAVVEEDFPPLFFVVWIDCNCGTDWPDGGPDWEIDNPDGKELEPLAQALDHAAECRAAEYPAVLMLPGKTPRSDGLFTNPKTEP